MSVEFALPELPEVAPNSSLLAPKEVDSAVRAQRRPSSLSVTLNP